MFIPIVPFIPNTNIINKTIVYSDTVLSLNDKGKNLKVTSIENVNEHSLENCLKAIFESNPNVTFNTIQYSKNDKKVYFYTNQDIVIKDYEESKFTSYKPFTSRTKILEEIKNVLLSEKNKDNNCISLYDVLILLRKVNDEYDNVKKRYESKLDYAVKNKISDSSLVCFHDIDFKDKTMHISFKRFSSSNWDNIYFAKQDGDLYVVKSESIYTDEIFSALCSTLSEMYDELIKYVNYKDYKCSKNNIKTINSSFDANISYYGVCLTAKKLPNRYSNELELLAPSYNDNYKLDCNSSIINEAFNGKETEIFKKIFVKISDCPEWSQNILYEIRQYQLAEEQKKEKRLEFKRNLFPFLKK